MKGKLKGYMCASDFDSEMWTKGADFPEIFRSQAALKRSRKMCWRDCGIVEVEIRVSEVKWPKKFSLEQMPIIKISKRIKGKKWKPTAG